MILGLTLLLQLCMKFSNMTPMIDLDDIKKAKGLKFCHINIRSLVPKIDLFRLHFETSGVEVITVSETWLSKEINSTILELEGYQLYRRDRGYTSEGDLNIKRGGGLLVYVHKNLNFTYIHNEERNLSTVDCELQRVEFKSSVQKNIILYNIYRPPGGSVDRFVDLVSAQIEAEDNLARDEIICMGDFNINYKRTSPDKKKLVAWHHRFGLKQLVNSDTRCAKSSRSMIDLIFSDMDHCYSSGVVNLHVSDHQPVYLIKKKIKDIRHKTSFKGRTYRAYNKDLLGDELTRVIKDSFISSDDPNVCWDRMDNFLAGFLNKYCPIKTFRTKVSSPAWVNHEILTMAKDRDRAWKVAKLTDREEDWIIARQFRNQVNNSIKTAKAHYIQEELHNNAANPKKLWRNIKDVLPDPSSNNINIANPITNEILPKEQQAQEINSFFADIGPNLAKKFFKITPTLVERDPNLPTLTLDHITQIEVLKLIDTISMYKSSGLDNISSRVLKDFMYITSKEFTTLYNKIIDTGIFPDKWKIATVTPIPKVSNATNPTDLRPISLLPLPGKLIEKHITCKIQNFLENNNYLVGNQNGFRKGKSTTSALSKFLDDIVTDLNGSKTNLTTYLDFQKAFDTIDHSILLSKLNRCGMGDKILALLRNYLTNRKQRTKLYNSVSDLRNVSIGVPQGSTIGPITFIIFINDLPTVLEHCNSLMYADDTVVYCAHPNNKVVRKMLQSDLCKVQKWCNDNRLTLNIKKTKLMSFMSDHKRKRCKEFKLYMRGNVLEEVNSYKYLGTEIDNRLNGDEQYNKLLQILGLKIRTFGKIRKFLSSKAALTVYKATILPLIDYNDHFQHMWNVIKLGKLQKMQNWGLRIVYGNNPQIQGEEAMHTAAGLMLLSERRTLYVSQVEKCRTA